MNWWRPRGRRVYRQLHSLTAHRHGQSPQARASSLGLSCVLKTFVESKRDCFKEYEKEGIEKSGTTEYIQRRQRRRNVRLDPLNQPRQTSRQQMELLQLTQSDKFRIENFLPVIDQFITALEYFMHMS